METDISDGGQRKNGESSPSMANLLLLLIMKKEYQTTPACQATYAWSGH